MKTLSSLSRMGARTCRILTILVTVIFGLLNGTNAQTLKVHAINDSEVTIKIIDNANACLTPYGKEIKYYLDGALTEPFYRADNYISDVSIAVFHFDTPEQSHTLYATIRFTGFWCDYSHTTSTISFEQSKLADPANFSASDLDYATSVVLTWNRATNYRDEYYDIYRENPHQLLGTVSGTDQESDNSYKFTHSGLEQGSEITYSIQTRKAGVTSSGVSETGHTFDFDFQASTDNSQKVLLTWNDANPLLAGGNGYTVHRVEEGVEFPVFETALNSSTACQDTDPLIPGYYYTYKLRTVSPSDATSTAEGRILPDGFISGTVKTPPTVSDPDGVGVIGVKVSAIRQGTVPTDTTSVYSALTNEDGEYTINHIYYYDESSFQVVPTLEGHSFNPADDQVTLVLNGTHNVSGIDFVDTSSFVISGTILQKHNEETCPMEGVSVLVDGEDSGITSDEEGNYAVTVLQANNYRITPFMKNHSFEPEHQDLLVTANTESINFTDTTSYTLSGYLSASCNIYIGVAQLGIYSIDGSACYSDTISTEEGTGYYSLELPARRYRLEVLSFTSVDENTIPGTRVMSYFTPDTINLDRNSNYDFIYRLKPEMSVTGFGDRTACGDGNLPIMEQYKEYELAFDINESFNGNTCAADTGFIVIEQTITGDQITTDTIGLKNGSAVYTLVPGEPNIIAPYKKWIRAVVHLERQTDTIYSDVIVIGYKPRGETFTTVTPSLPFQIVHDPPGDGSYSYFEKNTTIENAMSMSALTSTGGKAWTKQKLGLAFSVDAGVGIDIAVWAEYFPSIEVTAEWIDNRSIKYSMKHSQAYQTSGNQEIIGDGGDVFIGGAMNMLYALTDNITYNTQTCQVEKGTDIVVIPQGFRTTFMYTEHHIKNVIIPQMIQIRDDYLATGDDSASFYQNQLSVWEQIINNNKRNKAAAEFQENISFSSGTQYESFIEGSSSYSSSYEYKMTIDERVAIEAGFEVAGTGMSAGVEAFFKLEIGNVEERSNTQAYKTGYVLSDENTGDFFSVDVLKDPVYGTPVFRTAGGRSSCPWEPGTQAREKVQLLSDSYAQTVENEDDAAVFRLQMGNLSPSDEAMTYQLVFNQESNPDGAELTIGGSPVIGNVPYNYTIPAGGSVDATITVKKGPVASVYNDLNFELRSPCDDQIRDEVFLDVMWPSQCSGVTLEAESETPIINQASEGHHTFTLSDYDASNLEGIAIQLAPEGSYNWNTISSLAKGDITGSTVQMEVSFENMKDGNYNVRAGTLCNSDIYYSENINVLLDITPPECFGLPQPVSGILDSMQNISISFSEAIDCASIKAHSIDMRIDNTGTSIDYVYGCADNTLVILPANPAELRDGDEVTMTVLGIEDLQGNALQDTITWSFIVPESSLIGNNETGDYDFDGQDNANDNCLLTSNPDQSDLDEDGEGDACDDDIDGDGVLNIKDNCVYTANFGQEDSNGNGIGDVCEATSLESEIITPMDVRLYPNPAGAELICELYLPEPANVQIDICNIMGQSLLRTGEETCKAGRYMRTLNTASLEQGIYLVKFITDGVVCTRKIVKQ